MPDSNNHAEINPTIKRKVLRWSRQPLTRLQVVAVWIFVAIVAAITGHVVSRYAFAVASAAGLAFFLWPFVQGPYLLYTRNSLPLRANFRIFSGQLQPEFPKYRINDLSILGFRDAGQLVQDPGRRNVAVRVQMFVHPENRDSAHLAIVMSGLRTVEVLVFKSRFEDGFAFETNDSDTARIFDSDPNFPVFNYPDLRSTSDLYRLHCKMKERFVLSHRPTLADPEGEVAEYIARAEIVRQRHAHSGAYKFAPAGDRYVYTWKGAIRHAWLHTWPVKSFRTMRVHSRGMKRAEELGFRINPKFGRLEESLRSRRGTAERPRL